MTSQNISGASASYLPGSSSDDKTQRIFEMARHYATLFVSRPTGFGNTILIDALATLFANGTRDFTGTAIAKLWKDKTYNVIRLDFSKLTRFESIEDFSNRLDSILRKAISPSIKNDSFGQQDVLHYLSAWLMSVPVASLVLLIEDFDAPLMACSGNSTLFGAVYAKLARFGAIVKSKCGAFRFCLMTGLTPIGRAFCNHVEDITFESKWSEILGLTQKDLIDRYSGQIVRAAQVLGMSRDEVLEKLQTYYGGYCFDEWGREHLYRTNAVHRFFSNPQVGFLPYWEDIEIFSMIKERLAESPQEVLSQYCVNINDLINCDWETLSVPFLLYWAGLMTIKAVPAPGLFLLECPNESAQALLSQL